MLNILYTTLSGSPSRNSGGGNRIAYDLLHNISKDRFRAEFISYTARRQAVSNETFHEFGSLQFIRQGIGNRLYRFMPVYRYITSSPFYHLWYYRRIGKFFQRVARQARYDVIHAHHPLVLPYFKGHPAQKILTIHSKGGFANESKSTGFHRQFLASHFQQLTHLEREAIKMADIITFPSNAAKELFFTVNGISCPDEKVRIIYNGFDPDRIAATQPDRSLFQRFKIRENGALYIVNVADHLPQKNIDILLRAVHLMVTQYKKDVVLINIGKGKDSATLFQTIRELQLERNAYFIGHIPNAIVLSLMKSCDYFVLTSTNVIFDLVVLEALACGLPVFVSNDGGNREIIQDGINGVLLNIENERSIVQSLLHTDTETIKQNAVASVSQFTVRAMTAEYETLYSGGQQR